MDALGDFKEIWFCDFEFSAPSGERPAPVCMVAREYRTSRTLRLWCDELLGLSQPPFGIGPDCLFVAFYDSAELGCFLALDWQAPARILDLYAEFRCLTSGLTVPCGNGLLGALSWFGLDGLAAVEKNTMRELAQRGEPYTVEERRALLDYCASDVDALARLLPAILPRIDLPRALLRGRYTAAVARMEWTGIPVDTEALALLRESWSAIQDRLITRIDAGRGIYEGRTFKTERFAEWLVEQNIPWPRLAAGALDLSDDCFHEMGRAYPDKVSPIRELRTVLSQLRLESLAVGSDGRNRCLLSPFASRTGRNQPSSTAFIFGPSTWLRGLIRPTEANALAYVDWEQQEFGVAAGLARDGAMMQAYRSGDPYLAFAKQAGAVPGDGTKDTHKAERERFKVLSLAVQYGMGAEALARKLNEAPARGRELIDLHRRTYPRYWQWSDAVEMTALLVGRLQAAFGWTIHVGPTANPRSLRNFPLQADGAEMLRLACILATESGVRVCAPIHDALLIEAAEGEIEDAVAATQAAMESASRIVLAGFPLRTEAKIVRYPDRYSDPRGEHFWRTVWELIGEQTPITGDTLSEQTPITDDTPTPITGDAKPLSPAIPPSCLLLSSLIVSSKKEVVDGPPLGLGELPTTAEIQHTPETETETAAPLPNGILARADPLAVVAPRAVTGPGADSSAGVVARSGNSEGHDVSAIASPPTGSKYFPSGEPSRVEGARDGRPGVDPAGSGPLSGSDDCGRTGAGAERESVTALRCPDCQGELDGRRRCWRCCQRVCGCGRPTGTAFVALCFLCSQGET
jgi:hypothetical protein